MHHHRVQWQAERLGDDDPNRGPGADAEVLSADLRFNRTIRIDGDVAGGGMAAAAPRMNGDPEAAFDWTRAGIAAEMRLAAVIDQLGGDLQFLLVHLGAVSELEILQEEV